MYKGQKQGFRSYSSPEFLVFILHLLVYNTMTNEMSWLMVNELVNEANVKCHEFE